MKILIERANPDPCDHIIIKRADTGKVLLTTTRAEIKEPLTEADLLGCLKVLVRNAPSTVTTWAQLRDWLQEREF